VRRPWTKIRRDAGISTVRNVKELIDKRNIKGHRGNDVIRIEKQKGIDVNRIEIWRNKGE
jgi:hypothetical protein